MASLESLRLAGEMAARAAGMIIKMISRMPHHSLYQGLLYFSDFFLLMTFSFCRYLVMPVSSEEV